MTSTDGGQALAEAYEQGKQEAVAVYLRSDAFRDALARALQRADLDSFGPRVPLSRQAAELQQALQDSEVTDAAEKS